MNQNLEPFEHRVSTGRYGAVGILAALGTLAVAWWVLGNEQMPAVVRFGSGGLGVVIGFWFLRYAIRCLVRPDYFETSIRDGVYRQRIPNEKKHRETFEIRVEDIQEISARFYRDGATRYWVIGEDGKKKPITRTFWNPVKKILKRLCEERPEIVFRDDRTGEILESGTAVGHLPMEAQFKQSDS